MMAAYRRAHGPSRLTWSEDWRLLGTQSAFIKWTEWTLAMALPWWQYYKHWPISVIIIIQSCIISRQTQDLV